MSACGDATTAAATTAEIATAVAVAAAQSSPATTKFATLCSADEYFRSPHYSSFAEMPADAAPCDVFIAFDVEVTGQATHTSPTGTTKKNSMGELGVVAIKTTLPMQVLGVFEGFMGMRPDSEWDEKTVREFWERNDELRAKKKMIEGCQYEPADTMNAFADFLENVVQKYAGGEPSRVTFLSDNPGFDCKWIDHYLGAYTEHPPLSTIYGVYKAVLDTSSYNAGAAHSDEATRSEIVSTAGWYSDDRDARTQLQIPAAVAPPVTANHRAGQDAMHIAMTHVIIETYSVRHRNVAACPTE